SPSSTFSKRSAPGTSTSATPPLTRSSGPGFGKRPVCDGEQFTTTRTPASSSSSADTLSMSRWSIIAPSPGSRRGVRRSLTRSSRAGPRNSSAATLGSADRGEEVPTAEHSLQLALPFVAFQLLDLRVRRVAGNLLDAEMPLGEAGDLRKVSDRDHLRAHGGAGERTADGVRGFAADARVELVEDERVAARDHGDRERDAGELAARGRVRDGRQRHARVRPDQEPHLVGAARARLARRELRRELAVAHSEPREL